MPNEKRKKSPEAFRTISEVAEELDLPAHVLRFWETKFSQVRPLKRGGGRRYYRPEDIELIRQIRDLLYKNRYTIKGVQKLMRDGGLKKGEFSISKDHEPVASEDRMKSEIQNAIDELQGLKMEIDLHQ